MKKMLLSFLGITTVITLVACGGDSNQKEELPPEEISTEVEEEVALEEEYEEEHAGHQDHHVHMDHSSDGSIPEGLKEKESPTYAIGDKATVINGHAPFMDGAEVEIVGAFETLVYAVTYEPTDGGPKEIGHKWVIHEELVDFEGKTFVVGDEVELNAEHMPGMQGAIAEIVSVENTTVYMVNMLYTDGKYEENHKWVVEDELGEYTGDSHQAH